MPQAWVKIGDDDAWLERYAGLPLEHEVMFHDDGRLGKRLIRLARDEYVVETEIVGLGTVMGRRAGGRGDRQARHRGQFLPIDGDQLDRVLGLRPGRCDNGDNGLALPARFAPGERMLRRRAVAGKWCKLGLPRLADRGEIVAGHHCQNPSRLLCRRGVDAADAGVRMGAAHKRDVANVCHVQVVGVASPALGEAPGLASRCAAPDPTGALGHGLPSARRAATASIASTIA